MRLIFFFLLLFLVERINFSKKTLEIELKKEKHEAFYLELDRLDYYLEPLTNFPELNNKILNTYKGIPLNDSIAVFMKSENRSQFLYDLYKINEISKKQFLENINLKRTDTLKMSKVRLKQGFIAVVGFYKKEQFIIADLDRDNDFSNNIKYTFPIKFRENPSENLTTVLEKNSESSYIYERFNENEILNFNRKISFYPAINEPRLSIYNDPKITPYLVKYIFNDPWQGKLILNKKKYAIMYQGIDSKYGGLYVKPENINLNFNNSKHYLYYKEDTINIEKKRFVFDSIDINCSKVFLREIAQMKKEYGVNEKNFIRNYQLTNIENKNIFLYEIFKKKKFTIIDFWNSKCGPCIKMFPQLIDLQSKFKSKLNIISISDDKTIDEAKKAIKKNNMNWFNFYCSFRHKIHNDLLIRELPTLILVDNEGKIIYRGTQERELLKFIN